MKYTFLSQKFYNDYPHNKFPQMEIKQNRPYVHVTIEAYGYLFCIPLRSNIEHPHAFFTNKKEKCGVDYSKAVVIVDEDYIDKTTKVYLRADEHKKLYGKEYIIKKQLIQYIELYKRAKIDETVSHRNDILKFSTLQYFEKYIYKDTENNR
jgi:protein AbiQ